MGGYKPTDTEEPEPDAPHKTRLTAASESLTGFMRAGLKKMKRR